MYGAFKQHVGEQLESIQAAGLFKQEREITGPQGTYVSVTQGEVLNLCANNYLGLAQNPEVIAAANAGLQEWGYGLASVRFICGTQSIHKKLERKLTDFLDTEETILYSSCFDANGGLFEALLDDNDAVISDNLNHASIIDGVRLCKAKRYRYKNSDMDDLEARLKEADLTGARFKLITTDGVFSMDGYIAKLDQICTLAEKYQALVHVDDCHATGFLGERGRGSFEYRDCVGRIDVITSTLGKALGGASGGFTSGRKEIIELLRQRSRPYLFSNTVPPPIVAGAIKALELISRSSDLPDRLRNNTTFFRKGLEALGFELRPGEHPIVPIMIGDAARASEFAEIMLGEGIYVIAFSYPVVPEGTARIRTQMSAAHTRKDLEFALAAFERGKKQLRL